jgi:2-hydroxy-3-oxopropionate reductase
MLETVAKQASRLGRSVTELIGNTPLVRLNKLAPASVNLYVKLESFNPLGSVKDRMARAVIESAEQTGALKPGQTVKAANQLMVAGNIQLLAEAIVFLRAYGVDAEAALQVLGGGLAGSTVLNRKGASMLAGEFKPGFRLALHHKDMGIVTSAAREAGVTIPLGAIVAQLVAAMVARGDGGLDHSGLLKLVEDLSAPSSR